MFDETFFFCLAETEKKRKTFSTYCSLGYTLVHICVPGLKCPGYKSTCANQSWKVKKVTQLTLYICIFF